MLLRTRSAENVTTVEDAQPPRSRRPQLRRTTSGTAADPAIARRGTLRRLRSESDVLTGSEKERNGLGRSAQAGVSSNVKLPLPEHEDRHESPEVQGTYATEGQDESRGHGTGIVACLFDEPAVDQ